MAIECQLDRVGMMDWVGAKRLRNLFNSLATKTPQNSRFQGADEALSFMKNYQIPIHE
jgi:hypothetical protein